MTDMIRWPDELGQQLRARRAALGLSMTDLAAKAGKVREVIYRLGAGDDTTVSSLMAVLSALGMALRLERVGLPSAQEVARRFADDDDDDDDRDSDTGSDTGSDIGSNTGSGKKAAGPGDAA